MDLVEHMLKKSILQESIKIPNLQNLNDAERKDKMLQIIKKTSKENQIPFSAFGMIFKDSDKTARLFNLLGGGKNNEQLKEIENVQRAIKSRR